MIRNPPSLILFCCNVCLHGPVKSGLTLFGTDPKRCIKPFYFAVSLLLIGSRFAVKEEVGGTTDFDNASSVPKF
jgi:hypothetical protein